MGKKLILVKEDDVSIVNNYLDAGYKIEHMSACACQGSVGPHPYCYVYLTKE